MDEGIPSESLRDIRQLLLTTQSGVIEKILAIVSSKNETSGPRQSSWTEMQIGSVFHLPITICDQRLNNARTSKPKLPQTSMPSLTSLPDELLEMILPHLPAASLVAVSCTCRRLRELSMNDSLWMTHYERDKADWSSAGNTPTEFLGTMAGMPGIKTMNGGKMVHGVMTWRQRYLLCAQYPMLSFQVQPHKQTVLETLMGSSSKKGDRVAFLGSQGSHKQKILGFLLTNPRSLVATTPVKMNEGREWLSGLERPGVSLDIMGTPVHLTIISTVTWPRVFRACNGLCYVMPASIPHSLRLSQSRDELHRLLNIQNDGQTTPLLVIVTDKIEAGNANASSAQVAEYFGLYALQRQWRVQFVDLATFHGVLEGFKWLCYAMRR